MSILPNIIINPVLPIIDPPSYAPSKETGRMFPLPFIPEGKVTSLPLVDALNAQNMLQPANVMQPLPIILPN